eukprot:13581934-Alexandrium_andersonii.AAC.1
MFRAAPGGAGQPRAGRRPQEGQVPHGWLQRGGHQVPDQPQRAPQGHLGISRAVLRRRQRPAA